MRVGLVIYGSLEQTSGGYLYDRMVVKALRQRGHRVEVRSLRRKAYPNNIADNDDRSLRGWMREQDVVVQDELCHSSLFRSNGPSRRDRPPTVALVHNLTSCLAPPAALELARAMEREYLEGTDAVVCTSRATLQACRSFCPHLPPAIVVHPGKDHLAPRERRPGSGPLRILHVGSVHPTKGLDVLIAALSELMFVPFRLEVAGGTSDVQFRRKLEKLMDRPLREKVRFLGEVPPEGMADIYERTDLLAVPSRYEGYGIALIEAMGFGIPVIAGQAGGAAELVTQGREGFLVPPGDHGAVAGPLRTMADDTVRERLGRNARTRWEELPTWSESMARLVDLLENEKIREEDGSGGASEEHIGPKDLGRSEGILKEEHGTRPRCLGLRSQPRRQRLSPRR